ncbi:hypothetical protein SOVF_033430 isoform B [Spinacia oleracea]|uniref:B-box zinc finger protein 18 isoform X2 n=1 Tax=Spinacia oleracea TaxID=3562 RepID=A0A9R0IPK7_SPIOL|nr:B-box zinc finger protein 18-like isoform X2 [Spinacia oleracea]KNA22471.1 hypothetical protein SOVF_033430 isoform B [Spinacia oleracea]
MRMLCDICESAAASFFCAADEAALCNSCDEKVHSCNKLASRHVRVRLADPKAALRCDICENAPAFFYCEIDGTSLCLQCDTDVHVGGTQVHARYLLFKQQVEFPMDDIASTSMNELQIVGREINPDNLQPSSSILAPTLVNEPTCRKVVDLNISPQPSIENSSNNQTTVGRETNPDIHASSATVLAPGNEHTDRKVIDLNTSPRRSLENSSNN